MAKYGRASPIAYQSSCDKGTHLCTFTLAPRHGCGSVEEAVLLHGGDGGVQSVAAEFISRGKSTGEFSAERESCKWNQSGCSSVCQRRSATG